MVRFILQQIKITGNKCFGKWFAKNVVEETIDLDGLAGHMSNHNSPYSKGVIKGLLTDMIGCIKELLLEGKNVKIDAWPFSLLVSRTRRWLLRRRTSLYLKTSAVLS